MNRSIARRVNHALWFLEAHPAIGYPVFNLMHHLEFSIQEVCKHGLTKYHKDEVQVWKTPQNYKKFRKEFDKEMKEYTEQELKLFGPLISIEVPYKDVYGEPWKFDRVEYWGELSFAMHNDLRRAKKETSDRALWTVCSGISVGAASFEEMIIKLANKFKRIYGNFSEEDFLTKEEKDNHKKYPQFFTKKLRRNRGVRCSTLQSNKQYIHVTSAEINHRWQAWFLDTPYGRKNWKNK